MGRGHRERDIVGEAVQEGLNVSYASIRSRMPFTRARLSVATSIGVHLSWCQWIDE